MAQKTSVNVRDLANLTSDQVWRTRGVYSVKFDDGEVLELPSRCIKISWPYWAMTRNYPKVWIPSDLVYRKDEVPSEKKHIDMMSKVYILSREAGIDINDIRYILSQEVYADVYNNTVYHMVGYMTTIDLDTMLEIYEHPAYEHIKELARNHPSGFDDSGEDMVAVAYDILELDILKDPAMKNNAIAKMVQNKTTKIDHFLQAYVRGKMSEIDSKLYNNQVWAGFFTGLYRALDRLKEAAATSRSHLNNTDKIAQAEYGSRKLQLVANVISGQDMGDCGTEHAHSYTFIEEIDEAKYNAMVGMYFKFDTDPEAQPWRRFNKGGYKDVVGKPLRFRTAMCCKRNSDQAVCRFCLGDIIYNLSDSTAPGHIASITISSDGSQMILSTKHLDFIRLLFRIHLSSELRRYAKEYKFKSTKGLVLQQKPPKGSWKDYYLVIPSKIYTELNQLTFIKNLAEVDETSMPIVNDLTFAMNYEDTIIDLDTVDARMVISGNFSKRFLRYFKQSRTRIVERNKFAYLPLDKWPLGEPVIVYSNQAESTAEFVQGLETKFRSCSSTVPDDDEEVDVNLSSTGLKRDKGGKIRVKVLTDFLGSTEAQCTAALMDSFSYINRKLKGIPMTYVAMMLNVSRVESDENSFPAVGFDPEGSNGTKHFVNHNQLIGRRSGSSMFFYQTQQSYLDQVSFFVNRCRPEGLSDASFRCVKE